MSTHRTLRRSLWHDPQVMKLSTRGRLAYIYLNCNLEDNISGLYCLNLQQMQLALGLHLTDVQLCIGELCENDLVTYDETDGFIFVHGMLKDQAVGPCKKLSQKISIHIARHLDEMPSSTAKKRAVLELMGIMDTLWIPYGYPMDSLNNEHPGNDRNCTREGTTEHIELTPCANSEMSRCIMGLGDCPNASTCSVFTESEIYARIKVTPAEWMKPGGLELFKDPKSAKLHSLRSQSLAAKVGSLRSPNLAFAQENNFDNLVIEYDDRKQQAFEQLSLLRRITEEANDEEARGKTRGRRSIKANTRENDQIVKNVLEHYNSRLKELNPRSKGIKESPVNRDLILRPVYDNLATTEDWKAVIDAQFHDIKRQHPSKQIYFTLKTMSVPANFEQKLAIGQMRMQEDEKDAELSRRWKDLFEQAKKAAMESSSMETQP